MDQLAPTFFTRLKKRTKRFKNLFLAEADKFFRLRYLVPLFLFVILIACLPIFDFEKNFDADFPVLTEAQHAEAIANYKERLQDTKTQLDRIRNDVNMDASGKTILMLEQKLRVLEFLVENDLVMEHSLRMADDYTRGRTQGFYLKNSILNLLLLYALVAVFAIFSVCKEYSTKNSLQAFTSPAAREQIYFSKVAMNVLFTLAAVTLYFLVTACVLTRYPQPMPIVFRFANEVVAMTAVQAVFACYGFTLLAAIFSSILSITLSYFLKNIYASVAICVVCVVGIPWILFNWSGNPALAAYFPFRNFLFFENCASIETPSNFTMFTPAIGAASFIISSLLLLGVGAAGVNKMQHKE